MPKMFSRLAVPFLLLLCISGGYAEESPPFTMPCAQVLKLGLEKFMDVYGEKTGDLSTHGMKNAARYYYKCRRESNDARARRLSANRRQRLSAVRAALSDLDNACYAMLYMRAGGGTMYGLMATVAEPSREDFLGTLINTLSKPTRRSRRARANANASLVQARKTLLKLAQQPKSMDDDGSPTESRQRYLNSYATAKKAVARLRDIIRVLPDEAARRVASEVQGSVGIPLEEE